MATLNELRDEMFRAAERLTGIYPSATTREALIDAYNSATGEPYHRAKHALTTVLNTTIDSPELLEKSASVDRVMLALRNLKNIKAKSTSK